jgi:hypothetical protein
MQSMGHCFTHMLQTMHLSMSLNKNPRVRSGITMRSSG